MFRFRGTPGFLPSIADGICGWYLKMSCNNENDAIISLSLVSDLRVDSSHRVKYRLPTSIGRVMSPCSFPLSSLELLFTPASFAAQDTSFAWGEIFRIDLNSQFHIHTFLCSFLKMIFAKGTQPGQVGLKPR